MVALDVPRAFVARRPVGPLAAARLRRAFERLGPFYVKAGQFIASGRGLFPDVLVDEFAACRDRCPPIPAAELRRLVEAELGPLEVVFATFDDAPLAAASIAQVHRATLHDGRDVVVKVQRPDLAAKVGVHLRVMQTLARTLERAFPNAPFADPSSLVRLFGTTLLEELDFRLEAQNMVDIALDLEAAEVTDVVVPRPVAELLTARVLVMERLDGLHFDDLAQMQAAGIDTRALLVSGLRCPVEGATVFGRFHGDLHAGNVIVLPDGRFGLIDFGICARLDAAGRDGLQRLLVGIATGDVRAQVHGLDTLGALGPGTDRRALIATFLARQRHGRDELSVEDLTAGAPRIMAVFTEHKLRLPPALVLFFKDILYLNGAVRSLAPGVDLFGLFAELHDHFGAKYGDDRLATTADPYGGPITDAELAAAAPPPPGRPDPPTLRSTLRRFGPDLLVSALVPLAIFVAMETAWGLPAAIAGVTAWTVALSLARRARGRRSTLAWITLGLTLIRGLAGVLSGSGIVYFGPDVANNLVIGTVLLASVAFRRPLIGVVGRIFYPFPPAVRRHPLFRSVFTRLTVMWGVYQLASGALQTWLLLNADPSTFAVARRLLGLPIILGLFVISLRYPRRVLEADDEVVALLEGRIP